MDKNDFEGRLVSEKLAEVGEVNDFFEAIDLDDFEKANERKQTSERLVANFTSRANRGLWNGGQLPLGYKRNPGNPGMLLIDEQEADAVKTVFATFLKDKNLRTTCLKLSETGIKTKQFTNKKDELKGGNHFTVQSLHNILTNATYPNPAIRC